MVQLYDIVVWDASALCEIVLGVPANLEIIQIAGRIWADRYPDDIVMLVEE